MHLAAECLSSRTAYRQGSLHAHGRSGVLVIGRVAAGGLVLTVTAATKRPHVLTFAEPPTAELLQVALAERIGDDDYVDDVHGLPAWRRHLTRHYAEQIRVEVAA